MSAEENKAIVRRYLDAISGKDKPSELLDEYVAEEPLKEHIAAFEAPFPRYELIPERMIAEGDLVSVIGRVRGAHMGELMGIPPTGKMVEIPIHITYQLQDGKIVDHWMLTDNVSLLQQLGAMPAPAAS